MKITLSNGLELAPILVTGGRRMAQGASRDALTFVFPASAGMEALDSIFTAENCESMTVEDETGSYIHNGYTIRAELSKQSVEVTPGTAETEAVYEDRIMVCMAQRTYMESQLAATQAAVEMLCMPDVGEV